MNDNMLITTSTTFEQSFKKILENDLQKYLDNNKLVLSNDINFKPFDVDPNSIVGIIKSGSGVREFVQGYDMTNYPVNIAFYF